jgi:hypoxanthine-DNA glycosylase
MDYESVTHPFDPIYDERSRVLILGSFPSVKSREQAFFYGHPQNRFWKVIAAVTGQTVPVTIEEKRELLLDNGIAVWDVISACEIIGSSDSSIRNVRVNDLSQIIAVVPEIRIFANGTKSYELYQKYIFPETGREAGKLPSTSPANAAWSLEKLCETWKRMLFGDSTNK